MKRWTTGILPVLVLVAGTVLAQPGTAGAAKPHTGPTFLIGTLTGNAYAPDATGTVRSTGVTAAGLTFVVHLDRVPPPTTVGGRYYKVWLVYPASAVAVPGGTLTYNADGTADGTFDSAYHDFTVLSVTAENTPNGSYPQNDRVLEGSINVAQLVAALETTPVRLAVTRAPIAAAYHATHQARALQAVGLVTMAAGTTTLTVKNAAAGPASTILLTALGNPGGALWISARTNGHFTIKAAHRLGASVKVQYLIVNSPS